MSFEFSPYIIPLLIAAIVSIGIAIYAWARRSFAGALPLFAMAVLISIWTIAYALEITGTTLETKYVWAVIQYLGIAFAPYSWMLFSLAFSGRQQWLTRRFLFATAFIPAVTVLLALTTKWNGLIWSEFHVEQQDDFSALVVTHGAWFTVHFVYTYLMLLFGMGLLLNVLIRRQGMVRGQAIALLIAVLTPLIGNALYLSGNSPIPHLDLTPFSFTVTLAAMAWAIFGFHLIDVVPIARDRIVDAMREGMIVLDEHGHVVDMNPAAARMIGLPVFQAVGRPAAEILQRWEHLIKLLQAKKDVTSEMVFGEGESQIRFDVHINMVRDQGGEIAGQILLLYSPSEFMPVPLEISAESVLESASADSTQEPRSLIGKIIDFFATPLKTDLQAPPSISPNWYRSRERSFTVILRISALLGSFAYLSSLPLLRSGTSLSPTHHIFGLVVAMLWFLGLARNYDFQTRANLFLLLVFIAAINETVNYGFSVESFLFFFSFVIIAALLTGRTGALISMGIGFISLFSFAFIIGGGYFVPYQAIPGAIVPSSIAIGLTSVFVFFACNAAIATSTVVLMESLNKAWQLESQVSGLLQQERNLLEKRVTERTQELKEAEVKYRTLLEQLPAIIYQDVADEAASNAYISPQVETILGYTPLEWSSDPNFWHKILHPSDYDYAVSTIQQTITKGGSSAEYRLFSKDGRIVWVRDEATLIRGADEKPAYVQGIIQDITEEKLLQEQLQAQNDYLSILHQITLDLLDHRDLNHLLQSIVDHAAVLLNSTFCELLLVDGESLVVRAVTANQAEMKGNRVSREQAKLSWQAVDTKQPVVLDDYSAWPDRRDLYDNHPLHAVADFPILAGDRCVGVLALGRSRRGYSFTADQIQTGLLFSRLVALVLDSAQVYDSAQKELAERVRTEALLSESEARFRQIVENAKDMIYRVNMSGHFSYANPAALSVMGYQKESDVLGRSFLEFTIPEARHRLKRSYDRQFLSRTKNTYNEFPAVRADGQVIWVGQNVQLIIENDEVVGFQAVGRDITELKQTQEAMLISRDQALDASRFKSQLLSRVSHEFRTPLGGILGFAELLQHRVFGELNEKQDGAVANIIKSTNYLTGVVNDLLDEAQIESGSLTLQNEYFDPVFLIENIKAAIPVLASKKGLAFNAEISLDVPSELYGDPKRLQQVIINLCGNAIKFTDQGEVRVSFKRPAPAQWSIEVRDTGAGIPKEEQSKIFEPFRQINNAITRENRGSGLGLAITKQLVEIMGGTIAVESETGKGSVFIVTLPITNAPGE